MRQRHKEIIPKYKDFVCMKVLMPIETHAKILAEQNAMHESGKKISLRDLMVKITKQYFEK